MAPGKPDVSSCLVCKLLVKPSDDALQCESCCKWLHIKCQDFPDNLYSELGKREIKNLKFFCTGCEPRVAEIVKPNGLESMLNELVMSIGKQLQKTLEVQMCDKFAELNASLDPQREALMKVLDHISANKGQEDMEKTFSKILDGKLAEIHVGEQQQCESVPTPPSAAPPAYKKKVKRLTKSTKKGGRITDQVTRGAGAKQLEVCDSSPGSTERSFAEVVSSGGAPSTQPLHSQLVDKTGRSEQNWHTVKPKEKVVKGARLEGNSIKGIPRPPKSFIAFVGRCDPETTVDDIRVFLEGEGVKDIAIIKNNSKNSLMGSFRVKVNEADQGKILDPLLWGEGIEVRPWIWTVRNGRGGPANRK